MARDRGVPDEELFLNKPHNRNDDDCDSPTVEPLRIFKPQSPKPQEKPQERFRYPAPPTAAASSSSSTTATKQPTFPLPPGALSSANSLPLPYPDDDDLGKKKATRPTVQPVANQGPSSSLYNDISPRLTGSPENRGPGLAARRGAVPKPLSPDAEDSEDLFFKRPAPPSSNDQAGYAKKTYYPPPPIPSDAQEDALKPDSLRMSHESSVNRFASTASTSTTRASRGSPPPPETPIVEPGAVPGGGIEARYAASGISGTETLTSLQAQSAAAAQRLAAYGNQPPRRPWTPTESPDQQPHGPPTVYQGSAPLSTSPPNNNASAGRKPTLESDATTVQVSVLEQDFQRISTKTPPPAYSSVNPGGGSSYPNEKARPQQSAATSTPAAAVAAVAAVPNAAESPPSKKTSMYGPAPGSITAPQNQGHPAFANDLRPDQNGQAVQSLGNVAAAAAAAAAGTGGTLPMAAAQTGVASPPPLPEGWIAHLDQNSGQYYYIHLATQATQWEFPKGPNPLHRPEAAPLSPTASTYGNPMASPMFGGKQSMASPMFPPNTPGYAESIMSVAASATPSAAGFTGPPPTAGVDMYKIQPTNGVYFGPYLRYVNMSVEKGIWHGTIMVVTDSPQPPTIHIHLSVDLSPNPKQLDTRAIYTHQRWTFFKYDIDLPMGDATERWTYAVTSHLGCTRYEFVVAGRQETGWRFIAHSGNDFAAATSQNERSKLGGVSFMWKDVLQKNIEVGGFHAQLGLGDQLYGDRLWKEVPLLKQWLAMSGKENRKNAQWTARHEEDVSHAYFHYYTSHFDQPFLREAFAQIPHILQIDDHDM
jgi:hypothetical protein